MVFVEILVVAPVTIATATADDDDDDDDAVFLIEIEVDNDLSIFACMLGNDYIGRVKGEGLTSCRY